MEVKFKKGIRILCCLSVLLQFILVFISDGQQVDDMMMYANMANRIAETGVYYPNAEYMYFSYIHSPGYVNYLGAIISLFGTIKVALYINILLNIVLALEIFYLGKKFFNEKVAYLVLLLFTLYPTTYGIISFAGTELPYTVMVLSIIILYNKGGIKYALIAGIMAALANWIRPFLPVIVVVILFITFFILDKKIRTQSLVSFTITAAMVICIIGLSSLNRFGHFIFQSSTAGVNLMMGANDDADGSYDYVVFMKGNIGYTGEPDSLTVLEKDRFWQKRSVEWIMDNPGKWTALFPNKLFFMYSHDSHAMGPLSGDITLPVQSRPYLTAMVKAYPRWNAFQWLMFYNQLFYSICLVFFCIGVYYVFKSKNYMGYTLLLYMVVGTAIVLITVGTNRYHYPFIPVILLFASLAVCNLYDSVEKKRLSNK